MKKKTCPKCDGSGSYEYHWVECGNSQIDEWVTEKCLVCRQTGHVTAAEEKDYLKTHPTVGMREKEAVKRERKEYVRLHKKYGAKK